MSLNYDPGSAVGFNETWDTTFLVGDPLLHQYFIGANFA